jgi:hypothetical protein
MSRKAAFSDAGVRENALVHLLQLVHLSQLVHEPDERDASRVLLRSAR